MTDRDPLHLHPFARAKMEHHLALALADPVICAGGRRPVLQETYRPETEQAAAYAKGRDEHGNVIDPSAVVTKARPGQSWHGLERWERSAAGVWVRVPASFAWHIYIRDPDGSLEGIGANDLSEEDKARYLRLGELARPIDVRWGGDFDDDGVPFEPGEWDLGHLEGRPPGFATLSQVRAALDIQGGELVAGSLRA